MQHESEAELDALMGRLAVGDRSAFEPLFRALHPRALRLARARLSPAAADDVAQAALLKVFSHAHRFTAGRPALPWFYAIVANEVRDARRSARHHELLHEPDERAAALAESSEQELLKRELSRALELAVDTLDEESVEALRAQLGDAERPMVEPATFRKRVSRAYARLRVLLGDFR